MNTVLNTIKLGLKIQDENAMNSIARKMVHKHDLLCFQFSVVFAS